MLISVYARPSAPNISSIVESPLALLSSELPRSVIGMDSNAKNRLWNSPVTDTKGRELEDALLLYNLYLANIPTPELDFTPPSKFCGCHPGRGNDVFHLLVLSPYPEPL